MQGTVTKRDFFQIGRSFGWIKAVKILFSSQQTALQILMG